jgi:hypothetical protein
LPSCRHASTFYLRQRSIYAGKREVSVGGGNRSPPQAPERAWLKKTLLGSIGREREAFLQLWSLSRREVQIKHKTLQTKSLTGGFWLISNTPLITPPNMHIHTCTRILQPVRSAYQPPASSTFLSERTSHVFEIPKLFLKSRNRNNERTIPLFSSHFPPPIHYSS